MRSRVRLASSWASRTSIASRAWTASGPSRSLPGPGVAALAAGAPWAGDGGWPHEFATTDTRERADRTHAPPRAVRVIQRGVLGRFVIVLPLSASDAGSEGKM